VLSIAFSPDGSKIVSGSSDQTIRVWDASTGIEMFPPLQGHCDGIFSVAFSPDGSTIILKSVDQAIRVWEANTGFEISTSSESAQKSGGAVSMMPSLHSPLVSLDDDEWLIESITGRCLGRLPDGASYYLSKVHKFCYVGWTVDHELVILQFPE
jgi:WD40 repeat protein